MVPQEALARHGFQQVVDRTPFEGLDRVLIVGGDEHDLGAQPHLDHAGRHFEAAQAGHADIEQGQLRAVGGNRFQRAAAVLAYGHDLEPRPHVLQLGRQGVAQQQLILGHHAFHGAVSHAGLR